MDRSIYPLMAKIENQHWWFVARRRILNNVLKELHLSPDAEILEAGCGTGGNLTMLREYGKVFAMELDQTAREFAAKYNFAEVLQGSLPHSIPFGNKCFDLIVLFDVLEHLIDDAASLQALRSRLKKNGKMLITVPAYPFLWGHHDEEHHHFRRYVRSGLKNIVAGAGYKVQYVSYFNFILFPLLLASRTINRGHSYNELDIPPAWLNKLLTSIFSGERHAIGRLGFPFGSSIILLAEKHDS